MVTTTQLEVWLSHAAPFLHAGEGVSVCQTVRLPSSLLARARESYRQAMQNVSQILAPLAAEHFFIPGLGEASRAAGIHFADCDECSYPDVVREIWDVESRSSMDFGLWVDALDVDAETFPKVLEELNPARSLVLFELVDWLETYLTSVEWFPEDFETGEPATVVILFNDGDVEGSMCWVEPFAEPTGFFL